MKTILYGHAWLCGALTAFAFFGFVRAFDTTPQVRVWLFLVGVGLLWTLLGYYYVAGRDWHGGGGDDLQGPAPGAGAGRPAEGVAGHSRRRAAPARYLAPLLMLLVFSAVVVLLAAAARDRWSRNTGRPPARPQFINPTAPARPLPP